ncbi:MAG: FHA domain-containing protein [Firmicutes bacterium]|nr:FHA domain-containing protein [Bacillota bacterium]
MELRESRNGRTLTVYVRGAGIDWETIEMVSKLEIDEWMSIQVRDDDIRYVCPDFDPLGFRFENTVNAFDFYMIMAQIARTKAILEHLGLDERDILWDVDYIYMSLNTRELKFMYLPTKRKDKDNTVKSLILEIMYALNQANISDTFMTEFAFYLKRPGAFETESLIQYITEKENTISRLLRLNEPILYELPEMKKKVKKVEMPSFDIMDFSNKKVDIQEKMEEEVPEHLPEKKPVSKADIGIGDFAFLRKDKKKEEPIVQETIEEPTDLSSQLSIHSKLDSSETFATIRRLLTEEEKVVEGDEFYLGKSNKLTGFSISGNSAISRRHAVIFKEEDGFYIMDLESINHTFVNNRKVKLGDKVKLSNGDIIQLANERFEFHIFEL